MSEFSPLVQPSAASDANELVILEEGVEVQHTKAYGIGIDCHKDFIQVSVLVKRDLRIFEYRQDFPTHWNGLLKARRWAQTVVENCSDPKLSFISDPPLPFHYCIESTSCYHLPVLEVWRGVPSVINPTIAKAGRRKTDILDAKLLATSDLTGIWPEFYVPSRSVQEVRVLLSEVEEHRNIARRISNRINTSLLKFGYTIGRDGSVTKSKIVRAIIENQISDHPSTDYSNINPEGIPEDVRSVFSDQYKEFDFHRQMADYYEDLVMAKIKEMTWETRDSTLSGADMIRLLTSAPSIGERTASVWLAYIITPNRFPNSKALAAYCGLDPSLKISASKVVSTVRRGGHKHLHKQLCMCASILIKNHNEMFGKWGYNLYCQTGRWKKAANAVARKLAIALYYMQSNGQEFSYEKYNLIKDTVVIDIPIEKLADLNHEFSRYIKPLKKSGVLTTSDLIHRYYSCELRHVNGLGKKFFGLIKEFISNQKHYKILLEEG